MALYWFIRHFSHDPENLYPIDKSGDNPSPAQINYPHPGNLIALKTETNLCYYGQASSAVLIQRARKPCSHMPY